VPLPRPRERGDKALAAIGNDVLGFMHKSCSMA